MGKALEQPTRTPRHKMPRSANPDIINVLCLPEVPSVAIPHAPGRIVRKSNDRRHLVPLLDETLTQTGCKRSHPVLFWRIICAQELHAHRVSKQQFKILETRTL